jgi:hypothetical protein
MARLRDGKLTKCCGTISNEIAVLLKIWNFFCRKFVLLSKSNNSADTSYLIKIWNFRAPRKIEGSFDDFQSNQK